MRLIKKIAFVGIGLICILVSSYLVWREILVDPYIPRGYIDCEEHREETPWMDWTDFCWYQYDSTDNVSLPEDYQQVKEADIISIKSYFENTRIHLEGARRLDEYDFDPACINEGNAWILFTSEGQPRSDGVYGRYDDYTLYFIDKKSARLYYLNNNL